MFWQRADVADGVFAFEELKRKHETLIGVERFLCNRYLITARRAKRELDRVPDRGRRQMADKSGGTERLQQHQSMQALSMDSKGQQATWMASPLSLLLARA